MNRAIFFNIFLLFFIFYSLYEEYSLTKKCKVYFRKKDLVIEYLKASDRLYKCNSLSRKSCVKEKKLYRKTMLVMDKTLNE